MEDVLSRARAFGDVDIWVDEGVGVRRLAYANTILKTGRVALAKLISRSFKDVPNFYVNRMIFGDNGTAGGVPKFVNEDRQGLFGLTVVSKPVVASIDPAVPTQAVFTSVVAFGEANSVALNEMALQMANGDLYSMLTFPDLNKTSGMEVVVNWRISYV